MPLHIETFSNIHGGNAFFKAIGHPLAAPKVAALFEKLRGAGSVALYDPLQQAQAFSQFYDLKTLPLSAYYVQDVEQQEKAFNGLRAQLITEVKDNAPRALLVAAFDAARMIDHIRHLLPHTIIITSLDDIKLPPAMLSDKARVLAPINYATNFVFFRDGGGHHTRLVSANYWGGYGAQEVRFWCQLYDGAGTILASWDEKLGSAGAAIIIDSAKVRARFKLPEFTGQLFIHAVGIQGHDVVKYALDTYGDAGEVLSCTHDANSWPADYYAGLPAPDAGEEVVLWVQNSQPFPIPAGEIGLNVMGNEKVFRLQQDIAPFATHRLVTKDLLPQAQWPQQIEMVAGKYVVRPRYEVIKGDRQRIAHMNVERSDLKPDATLPKIIGLMGKGHILPAPILPLQRFESFVLPTPMARGQQHLPLAALVYDSSGKEMARHAFGNLSRGHAQLFDLKNVALPSGYGHIELVYDFTAGQEADGWLHALFRYKDKHNGHVAESSFGSHIFNTVLTYKNEPQSYIGRPPGLSTRLFLRLGQKPYDTMCHLIYPASTPWHALSDTALILHSHTGEEVAKTHIKIPCSGSYHWRVSETFDRALLDQAGEGAYIIIRDTTCRLFGYHGLLNGDKAFSLDHMFGF